MPRFLAYIFLFFLIGITPLFAQGEYFQKRESGLHITTGIHGLNNGHGVSAGLYYSFWSVGDIGFEISDSHFLLSEGVRRLDKTTQLYPKFSLILVRDQDKTVPFGLTGSIGFLLRDNHYTMEQTGGFIDGSLAESFGALALGLTFYMNPGDSAYPKWQPYINLESRSYSESTYPETTVRLAVGITNFIPIGSPSLALGITPSYIRERDNWAITLTLGLFIKTADTDPGQKSRHPRNKPIERW